MVDKSGLRHVATARFESNDLPRCLEGTRVELLDEVHSWIQGDVKAIPKQERIFWLCGQAGTGKTTVSLTIAERLQKENSLGASFFFSRDHADRNDLSLVFPSLAHQLGIFYPPFGERVAAVLRSNPDLSEAAAVYQFESLIINPLLEEEDAFPSPVVIILDALDECTDDGPVSKILTILGGAMERLPRLKFFLTSRPEVNIRQGFRDPVLDAATKTCILHEIENSVVDHDIERYLRVGFHHIGRRFSLLDDSHWPSDDIIRKLVKDSYRLFIFASTVIKFVGGEADDPIGQLEILHEQATRAQSAGIQAFHTLDQLYYQVLQHALPPTRHPDTFTILKAIVGTIVLLCDPLSLKDLAALLNIPTKVIRTALRRLHSVMTVPDDDAAMITLCHPSFHDYITQRCHDSLYTINTPLQHNQITILCFEQMKHLERNMCKIDDPSKLNLEINDLQTRLGQYLSPTLIYACLHWPVHFSKATQSLVMLGLLKEFFSKRFLYWLEVLSLLGSLQKVPGYLRSLRKVVEVSPEISNCLSKLSIFIRYHTRTTPNSSSFFMTVNDLWLSSSNPYTLHVFTSIIRHYLSLPPAHCYTNISRASFVDLSKSKTMFAQPGTCTSN